MKKTWVKKSEIYYKPFYKQKSKVLMLAVFLLGIIFLVYQAFSINQLPPASTPWDGLSEKRIRIVHPDTVAKPDGMPTPAINTIDDKAENTIKIIRGIRLFDYDAYKPNFRGNFKCLDGSGEIPFHYLNDNYCDCIADGSDEPSSNACANGRFYCKYQKRHITGRGRDVYVPSSRVNDGICDCCDGSDEWLTSSCLNKCT